MNNDILSILIVALSGLIITLILFILSYLKKDDYNKGKKHFDISKRMDSYDIIINRLNTAKNINDIEKISKMIKDLPTIESSTKNEIKKLSLVYEEFIIHPLIKASDIAKITLFLKEKNKLFKAFFKKKENESLQLKAILSQKEKKYNINK